MNEPNNIDPIFTGETFYGFTYELFETVDLIDIPVDLTGADVIMSMRDISGKIVHTFSTVNTQLSVQGHTITFPEQIITVEGTTQGRLYSSDLNIKLLNGDVLPGLFPTNWTIKTPITIRP